MYGGINFIRPFPSSFNNQFILLVVDYVSTCVKAATSPTNDFRMVVKFLRKNIFTRFIVLKLIINDRGKHFCHRQLQFVLTKYRVIHKVIILYYP